MENHKSAEDITIAGQFLKCFCFSFQSVFNLGVTLYMRS